MYADAQKYGRYCSNWRQIIREQMEAYGGEPHPNEADINSDQSKAMRVIAVKQVWYDRGLRGHHIPWGVGENNLFDRFVEVTDFLRNSGYPLDNNG